MGYFDSTTYLLNRISNFFKFKNRMEDLQDKIKGYVKGQLADTERLAFESELAQNGSLQQEVQATQDLIFVFQHEKLLAHHALIRQLKDTIVVEPDLDFDLDSWLDKPDETLLKPENTETLKDNSQAISKRWWSGLALVGLLSVVFYSVYQQKQQANTLKNLSATHTLPTRTVQEDNTNAATNTPLGLGMQYYAAKSYAQAMPHLQAHLQKHRGQEPDYYAHLYLGISALMVQQHQEAVQHLGIVARGQYSTQINLSIPAKFYYALAQMAMGQKDSVRAYLHQVQMEGQDTPLSAEAAAILNELNKAGY
jgi:hypothetical protein